MCIYLIFLLPCSSIIIYILNKSLSIYIHVYNLVIYCRKHTTLYQVTDRHTIKNKFDIRFIDRCKINISIDVSKKICSSWNHSLKEMTDVFQLHSSSYIKLYILINSFSPDILDIDRWRSNKCIFFTFQRK